MPVQDAIDKAKKEISIHPEAKIEYLVIADSETLSPVKELIPTKPAVALIVANYNGVRLLDNIML